MRSTDSAFEVQRLNAPSILPMRAPSIDLQTSALLNHERGAESVRPWYWQPSNITGVPSSPGRISGFSVYQTELATRWENPCGRAALAGSWRTTG